MKIKLSFFLVLLLSSCYSFKGISIDPNIKTFILEPVQDLSNNAPSIFATQFYEGLTNKIKRDTRLNALPNNPDLTFKCKLTNFDVSSQAPVAGATSAINRLNITIEVECINAKNEKQNWKQNFSRFEDFAASANFISEQTRLIESINKDLYDDIFNRAFSNW